ncbi:hypothetical protein [Novilysobacter erysipheiresistens]|uniref:Uncharacterized protein n=1 Tax=Novilysobacter erysipheiresistens TaxID=1749332 RepID=A0ABU7YUT6_9GAMM
MSAPRWYDRAAEQIDADYDDGLIDSREHHEQMRDLNAELREAAEEEARQAYDGYMGCW